ncbi:dynein regulatory complex protein 9 [Xenentodon cancila]
MSLSWMQTLRVAAVLEDCTDRLDILGHTMTVEMTREDGTTPVQEKNRLLKLARDCQFISQQMSMLHFELQEKQSFSSLVQALEEEQRRKETIKREEYSNKLRKRTLLKQKQEIENKTRKINDIYILWQQLRDKTVLRKNMVQQAIVLKSQVLQNEARKAENLLVDQLQLLRKQVTNEMESHEETGSHLQNQHEELQRVLHEWQQSTKQMLQDKQKQLDNVCCKRTLNLDKLMDMRRKFREMEQVVMEEKEEQEQLRQQEAKAIAASRLQAWWRGCMVRRGLGTFKKAEVEKKDKKKKTTGKKRK